MRIDRMSRYAASTLRAVSDARDRMSERQRDDKRRAERLERYRRIREAVGRVGKEALTR